MVSYRKIAAVALQREKAPYTLQFSHTAGRDPLSGIAELLMFPT